MDVPGLSLFQGAESIQVNNSAQQRIEEEDAKEDQMRRNEELKNELQNAFDDLDDDDENDLTTSQIIPNSSPYTNGKNYNDEFNYRPHINNNHNGDVMDELRQLKNALASKTEEVKNLTAQNTSDRQQYDQKLGELKKRLAISEAEKERAHMSRQQTHELFVESKQKLSERDEEITELTVKIKLLNTRNLDLVTELEHTKSLLSDVQHKYLMIERNGNFSTDRHAESVVKQLNDRNATQIDVLQQQMSTLRTKLDDRDSELKRLMIQNNELHKSREAMLLDKSDTINQMNRRLDESQRQCQSLIMKQGGDSSLIQENLKLSRTVAALEVRSEEMQKTIYDLNSQLEMTTSELEQLTESVAHDKETDFPSSPNRPNITETPVIRKPSNNLLRSDGLFASSTPMIVGDRLIRLKHELNRCVADLKEKRSEITALKEQIIAKNRQIEQLKIEENRALIDCTVSKESAERLSNRLKAVESEFNEFRKHSPNIGSTAESDEQSKVLTKLEEENANFRKNFDLLTATIKELEDERDRIEEKYRESCQDTAELQRKLTQLEASPDCSRCENARFEILTVKQEHKQLKELYLRLHDENEDISRKLQRAEAAGESKGSDAQREVISSLEQSLQLAESKYAELTKKMHRDKTAYERHVQSLLADANNLNESNDRRSSMNICKKCSDLKARVNKFDLENLQLQTTCSDYLKEMHELKKMLKAADQRNVDLKEKLAMKEEHDQLIDDLKSKAKQFEEFMRNQSPTKNAALDAVLNNNRVNRVRDQCVSTEDLLEDNEPRSNTSTSTINSDRAMDKKIREEMARAMAVKVKAVENQFKQQLTNYEKLLDNLTAELNEMQQKLSDRDNAVTNLKKCILSERAEMKNILEQKEDEFDEQLRRQHMDLVAIQNELQKANRRVELLTRDLNEHSQQFEEERTSWTKLLNEYKNQMNSSAEQEKSLYQQIANLETAHKTTIQSLTEKYHATKKMAANYKKYSEDKEKHIERESDRIKMAFQSACTKMKEEMASTVQKQEKKANQRIADLQAELAAVKNKKE